MDGSPASVAALEHAMALAEDSAASVELLYVDAPNRFEVGSTTARSADGRAELERERESACARAQEQMGDRVSLRRVEGDPFRKILEVAAEDGCDLIVMGTHGRAGRLHGLLGSVAEAVVRNAPCPVLTVREPGGEYQGFAERRHGRPSPADEAAHHPR
jgi:nucleotide-binding universal stress UspA family protein